MKKGVSIIWLIMSIFIIICVTIVMVLMDNNSKNDAIIPDTTTNDSNIVNTVVTLQQVADKVTNCKTSKAYIEVGTNVVVEVKDNILNINVGGTNYEYTLDNGILTSIIPKTDFTGGIFMMAVIDSVGQVHGYEDGQLFATLNSDEAKKYTLKDGVELVESEDALTVKIDINKKMKLVDFSNIYLKVLDLQDGIDYIKGNGSYQTSKGDLIFYKMGYDDEAIISIGEKTNLTENAYKSILSTIEIIFDKNEVDSFAKQCPTLTNKTFGKYTVEISPELSDMEGFVFGDKDYKLVRVTIDKSK